ncbi:uncharacterized mitochondrial protein AtMg00860-like [Benincasa hispida]|uniref:uncharacterized mitochondrial protein AtMg00860-like n=1 Tax=Benincasa hispida TaxID=102211 RepID=UPI0018FFC9BE|nr:uncharacterized mitochondrial protein AtMg00860-like [Benincasa hispida]
MVLLIVISIMKANKLLNQGIWSILANVVDTRETKVALSLEVYSKIEAKHDEHLRKVLETMRSNKLYAKFSKCEFWLKQVFFLGRVVSKDEVSIDPEKIEVVMSWPHPMTVSEVHSFLGLAGYYYRFVKDFSRIATPLTKLTRKGSSFIEGKTYEDSFQDLKQNLISTPFLTVSDGSRSFIIYSDAPKKGLGFMLMQ